MLNVEINPLELDFIFLSYRESCADENYKDLLKKVPNAKRVHGVKGFSAAHKEAASKSSNEWFFTVDADSTIYEEWLKKNKVKIPSFYGCVCWKAYNPVLFSSYGNGGLKLWSKTFLRELRSHEDVDEKNKKLNIDFCYDERYVHYHEIVGETNPFHSPYSSFSAGFREGLKLIKDAKFDNFSDIHTWPKENKISWIKWTNLSLLYDKKYVSWGSFAARFSSLNYLTIKDYKQNFINSIDDLYSLYEEVNKEFGEPFTKKWMQHYEKMGKILEEITSIPMKTIIRSYDSKDILDYLINYYKANNNSTI